MNKPEISVIIPVYNEENNINELYNRIAKALKDINDYEMHQLQQIYPLII